MSSKINTKMLKEALEAAENALLDIKDDSFKSKQKRRRINSSMEKAYATLNLGGYSQRVIDKRTDEVWDSMLNENNYMALMIFIFGILLSGSIVFTVYQAFAFVHNYVDADKYKDNVEFNEGLNSLVGVDYKNENMVILDNKSFVKDSVGLANSPYEFSISNDSNKNQNLDYFINYSVYLIPLNEPSNQLINKKNIKFKYSFKDSNTGKYYESGVGTLDDLTVSSDGAMLLTKGTQNKDSMTNFKVTFWVGLGALNEEQNSSYTFKFKVDTNVAKAR